jgi:hypothetical protein
MDDERTPGAGAPREPTGTNAVPDTAPAPPKKKSRLWLKLVGILVVLPVLLFVAWTAITLSWTYSRGERAGYIQKFSQKGWVCKTWEGDMAMSTIPGSMPERFAFSVRDDSVARELTKLMGSRVAVTYEQHRGVPGSCFGETEYYVTDVKRVAGP